MRAHGTVALSILLTAALAAGAGAQGGGEPAPEAPAAVEEVVETVAQRSDHEVVPANTLWDLAEHYYKNPWLWPRIYEANKDKIKDPHWIYPGQVFIIPGFDRMVQVARKVAAKPQPEPEPEPEPEPAPAPPAPPPAPEYRLDEGGELSPDGLSARLPEGMVGQRPAVHRMRMPSSWAPDGEIVEFADRYVLAAEGDRIPVLLKPGVKGAKGQRYGVYRAAAPLEGEDETRRHFQKIGVVRLVSEKADGRHEAEILKSGGEIQAGDLLKRE